MVVQLVVLSVALFAAQVALVWALGAWTLVQYRHGGLHRLQQATIRLRGPLSLVADVPLAALVTFCGCMTQPVVFAFDQAGQRARAVRFLALSSVLRTTTLIGVVLAQPSERQLVALAVVVLLWAELVARRAYDVSDPIARSSVFVRRTTRAPVALALADSTKETKEMLARYAPHLVVPSFVAALLLALEPAIPWQSMSTPLLAVLAAVAGALIPLDLIAVLPLVLALASLGAPAAALLPLVFGVEAGSVRTRRVVEGYLSNELRPRYSSLARALPWVLAVALAALGS
jgi:hypothetical protein